VTVAGWNGEVRPAAAGDLTAVACLAAELAQSFAFSPERFRASYPSLLADHGARLLLAADGQEIVGYLLGFRHLTFYANGPVAWVEEVIVRPGDRGRGVGGALMSAFEQWAEGQGCAPVALATRPAKRRPLLPRRGVRGVRRLLPQGAGRRGSCVRQPAARAVRR
jgi:GNAT superfamily N-acetyltransferase